MTLERTAQTYGPGVTAASRAALLEVMTLLRAYRDALVLVGGWAPFLLLEQHQRPEDRFVHVGSIDIDLAVDPSRVDVSQYATMLQLLAERGYRPVRRQGSEWPASVERTINSPRTHKPYVIRIDFLTHLSDPPAAHRGRYSAPAPMAGAPPVAHRGRYSAATSTVAASQPGRSTHRLVQEGLLARKIKGCEAAFRYQTTVSLAGTLPDGGRLTVSMRMADVAACLTMKGIVLGERYREKDAYDIYALAAHYAGGPRDVAEALRPHLEDPLVREGMTNIRDAFASREAHGPAWVASFLTNPMFASEHQRCVTDAFMTVSEFSGLLWGSQPTAR